MSDELPLDIDMAIQSLVEACVIYGCCDDDEDADDDTREHKATVACEVALRAAIRAALPATPAPMLDGELAARRFMWLGHGHMGLYGDDGEMQCAECVRFGACDYKRDPFATVVKAATEAMRVAGMLKLATPAPKPDEKCPTCGGALLAVKNTTGYLNDDQAAAQRAGDFYCAKCPPNGRSEANKFCYWWKRELPTVPCPQAKPDVTGDSRFVQAARDYCAMALAADVEVMRSDARGFANAAVVSLESKMRAEYATLVRREVAERAALHATPAPTLRPEVVCLCGSTRFKDAFVAENERLTLAGKIVLSVGSFGHSRAVPFTDAEKAALDELHKRKIDLADRVLVLNVGGYVGASTKSEIAYATAHGKPVDYLEPEAIHNVPPVATPAPKPDAKCPTIGGVTVHTGDVPDGAILPFVGGAKCSSCGEVAKPDATGAEGDEAERVRDFVFGPLLESQRVHRQCECGGRKIVAYDGTWHGDAACDAVTAFLAAERAARDGSK